MPAPEPAVRTEVLLVDDDVHLARAMAVNPDDATAGVLAQRCRRLGLRPAGEWTGAWTLTEK